MISKVGVLTLCQWICELDMAEATLMTCPLMAFSQSRWLAWMQTINWNSAIWSGLCFRGLISNPEITLRARRVCLEKLLLFLTGESR